MEFIYLTNIRIRIVICYTSNNVINLTVKSMGIGDFKFKSLILLVSTKEVV